MRKQQDDTTTGAADKIALVPKLRFPGFLGSSAWESAKFGELVDTVTPPKKLSTSSYSHKGAFPIIDQSQNAICGWTDDHDALIKDHLPLVIFGDHTCILKLVYRAFAQGADGIKIIKPRSMVDTSYIYQYLKYQPVVTEEYKRHYSILKEKVVLFPDFKTGEQQKIADCLSSLDELIAAQTRKVDALKTHKKGLMQQIFPREGETQPRLRFPEFRDASDWENSSLGAVFSTTSGGTPSRSEAGYWDGEIPWVTTSLVNSGVITEAEEYISEEGLKNSSAKLLPKGTVLIAMYGQGKTRGQVALLSVEAATNQACAAILPKEGVNPYFVFLNLAGRYEELRKLSNSGGQENLSQGLIRDFSFAYPVDETEQQRIADCLTSLDTLITTATQELEALKTHKKGLMQQLFPSAQAGEG
ncbi:MAG: restriction endonuclease subunit S [Burkholderiaceae bacterium]|nr:restriction endonuclease subunit S [Burkholderiaceae bacterium]